MIIKNFLWTFWTIKIPMQRSNDFAGKFSCKVAIFLMDSLIEDIKSVVSELDELEHWDACLSKALLGSFGQSNLKKFRIIKN